MFPKVMPLHPMTHRSKSLHPRVQGREEARSSSEPARDGEAGPQHVCDTTPRVLGCRLQCQHLRVWAILLAGSQASFGSCLRRGDARLGPQHPPTNAPPLRPCRCSLSASRCASQVTASLTVTRTAHQGGRDAGGSVGLQEVRVCTQILMQPRREPPAMRWECSRTGFWGALLAPTLPFPSKMEPFLPAAPADLH